MVKKLGDMKISKKFTFAFTVLTLVSLIVGIVGIFNIFTIKTAGDQLYQEYTQGLEYSGSAAVDYQQLRYSMLKLMYSESSPKSDIDTLVAGMKQSLVDIQNLLDECDRVVVAPEYQATLNSIEANWAKYKDIMNLNIDYVNKGDFKSLSINAKAAGDLGTAIRTDFLKLFNDLSQAARHKAANNQTLAYAAAIAIAAAFIVGAVIAIVLGRYFAAAIGDPVKKLAAAAEHLGVGNADVTGILDKKDYDLKFRKDEIGILALAFNKLIAYFKELSTMTRRLADGDLTVDVSIKAEEDMLGKDLDHLVSSLNELVASIMSSAEQVQSGSGMLSGSSTSLSQGATEQASAIEQLTASLATMTEKIQSNAQNAVQASQLSAQTQQHADSGNVLMNDMRGAMDDISASSKKISKIIKVIDDIAFQTNILALNAAVEAARAGQQGKGFAVVAEEVRTLAAKSATAAKETTEMIENSISKVEAGTLIAARTAQALESIVLQVQDVAKLVNAIAEASQAQAHGLEQISLGVSQVSQVTSTTVATSEETAAASEELAGQSAQLKETVGIFKVKAFGRELPSSPSRQTLRGPGRVVPPSASVRISLDDNDMGKY